MTQASLEIHSDDLCIVHPDISDIRPYREPLETAHGVIYYDQVTMDNGTQYRNKTGIPDNLESDVPVDFTTAWGTSEEGHNHRTLLRIMSRGSIGRLLGPERLPVDVNPLHPVSSLKNLSHTAIRSFDIDLAKSAHNYLTIIDGLDGLYSSRAQKDIKHKLLPGVSILYGESRGAMIAFGLFSQAANHGREIVYGELIDPCLAKKVELSDLFSPKLLKEAVALGRLVALLSFEPRGSHYLNTFDPSLDYLLPAIGTSKTLFSGKSGSLAKGVPQDANMHITFFDLSLVNHADLYRAIFQEHSGVKIDDLAGCHLTLTEREILFRSLERISKLELELSTHENEPDIIDFSAVHEAHLANERILPSSKVKSAA